MVTWCFIFCKKNIQNTYIIFLCCFFFKKSCKNDFFFSQRQTFKKCHILLHLHYTQVENHQFRVFLLHYFLLLFFRQRSFFHKLVASFCFHGFLFVIGWKLLLLSFLNMFKLVCCLDWFYEKCTTKYGEHSRRLKHDKTNIQSTWDFLKSGTLKFQNFKNLPKFSSPWIETLFI